MNVDWLCIYYIIQLYIIMKMLLLLVLLFGLMVVWNMKVQHKLGMRVQHRLGLKKLSENEKEEIKKMMNHL